MSFELELERVHARDGAGRRGMPLGRVHGVTLRLPAGVHALLGTAFDGTAALSEICSGRRRPRAGRVRLRKRDHHRSAVARRRIAAMGVHAELAPVGRVRDAVALAVAAHGSLLEHCLDDWGLGALSDRRIASLGRGEARAVELALAMAVPDPQLLLLYEPFADVALLDEGLLRERLAARARDGCCVLLLSSAVADVEDVADHVHLLEGGRLVGSDAAIGWPAPSHELVAWLPQVDGCRDLARALSSRVELRGVAWEGPSQLGGLGFVAARSDDLSAATLAFAEEVARLQVQVTSLHTPPRSLEQVRQLARLRAAEQRSVAAEAGPGEQPSPEGSS